MDAFSDAELVKLATLSAAFVVGVLVCIYVAFKEAGETRRRNREKQIRREKQMMYRKPVGRQRAA